MLRITAAHMVTFLWGLSRLFAQLKAKLCTLYLVDISSEGEPPCRQQNVFQKSRVMMSGAWEEGQVEFSFRVIQGKSLEHRVSLPLVLPGQCS